MRKMTNNAFVHVFTLIGTVGLAIQLTGSIPFPSTVLAEEAQAREAQPALEEQGGVTERGIVRDHRKTVPISPIAPPLGQRTPPPPAPPPPPSVSAGAYDVTNCPICSQEMLVEWQETTDHSFEVAGKDVLGHRIGNFVPKSQFDGNKNWFPNLEQKLTVCGTVDKFSVFNTIGDEWDWNIFIRPDPHYGFAIRDVMKRLDPSGTGYKQVPDGSGGSYPLYIFRDWHVGKVNQQLCADGFVCDEKKRPFLMEAEVTPSEEFYVNPWFWRDYERDASGRVIYKLDASGSTSPVRKDRTILLEKQLCTYGAWVREQNHGFRPEIHPSELLWWRQDNGALRSYYLMQVQDDSNRFDWPGNFEGAYLCDWDGSGSCTNPRVRPEIASWWRPWARTPRVGQFRIAFEVDLSSSNSQVPVYTIHELSPQLRLGAFPDPNDILVKPHVTDTTPGIDHTIVISKAPSNPDPNRIVRDHRTENKKTVLKVREHVRFADMLGVRFDQICRDPATNKLKGFIQLNSAIGRNSNGKEGYQVLRVDRDLLASSGTHTIVTRAIELESPIIEAPPVAPSVRGKLVPGSLRRVEVNGRPQLAADIEVTPNISGGQPPTNVAIAKAEHVEGPQRVPRTVQPADPTGGVSTRGLESTAIVQEVSLTPTSRLAVTLQSGEQVEVPLPSTLSITPRLLAHPLPQSQPDSATWEAWAGATGAPSTSPPPIQISLLRPTKWQMDVAPVYAPLRDGKPSLEDDSPIAEQLNEAIRNRDPERLTQVLGSAQPFTIQWLFAARNLITHQPVAVKTNGPLDPAVVRVDMLEGIIPNGTLQIKFPDQIGPGLYELVATATITDTLGNSGSFSEQIWSHFLGGQSSAQIESHLWQLIESLSGLPAEEVAGHFSQSFAATPITWAQDTRARQLQTLRLFTKQAAEDQVVSFEEFSGLLGMAKQIGAQERRP